jgi:hypothetical protein
LDCDSDYEPDRSAPNFCTKNPRRSQRSTFYAKFLRPDDRAGAAGIRAGVALNGADVIRFATDRYYGGTSWID